MASTMYPQDSASENKNIYLKIINATNDKDLTRLKFLLSLVTVPSESLRMTVLCCNSVI